MTYVSSDDLQTQAWKALGEQGSAWCARPHATR